MNIYFTQQSNFILFLTVKHSYTDKQLVDNKISNLKINIKKKQKYENIILNYLLEHNYKKLYTENFYELFLLLKKYKTIKDTLKLRNKYLKEQDEQEQQLHQEQLRQKQLRQQQQQAQLRQQQLRQQQLQQEQLQPQPLQPLQPPPQQAADSQMIEPILQLFPDLDNFIRMLFYINLYDLLAPILNFIAINNTIKPNTFQTKPHETLQFNKNITTVSISSLIQIPLLYNISPQLPNAALPLPLLSSSSSLSSSLLLLPPEAIVGQANAEVATQISANVAPALPSTLSLLSVNATAEALQLQAFNNSMKLYFNQANILFENILFSNTIYYIDNIFEKINIPYDLPIFTNNIQTIYTQNIQTITTIYKSDLILLNILTDVNNKINLTGDMEQIGRDILNGTLKTPNDSEKINEYVVNLLIQLPEELKNPNYKLIITNSTTNITNFVSYSQEIKLLNKLILVHTLIKKPPNLNYLKPINFNYFDYLKNMPNIFNNLINNPELLLKNMNFSPNNIDVKKTPALNHNQDADAQEYIYALPAPAPALPAAANALNHNQDAAVSSWGFSLIGSGCLASTLWNTTLGSGVKRAVIATLLSVAAHTIFNFTKKYQVKKSHKLK